MATAGLCYSQLLHRTAPMAGVPVPAQSQQRVTCYRTLKQTANRRRTSCQLQRDRTPAKHSSPVRPAQSRIGLIEHRLPTLRLCSFLAQRTLERRSQLTATMHVHSDGDDMTCGTKCGILRATSLNAISPIGIYVRCTVLGSVCLSVCHVHALCLNGRRYRQDFLCIRQPHCLSQIALKFGLHQSTPSSPNLARKRPPVDLSVGDIRWQIAPNS